MTQQKGFYKTVADLYQGIHRFFTKAEQPINSSRQEQAKVQSFASIENAQNVSLINQRIQKINARNQEENQREIGQQQKVVSQNQFPQQAQSQVFKERANDQNLTQKNQSASSQALPSNYQRKQRAFNNIYERENKINTNQVLSNMEKPKQFFLNKIDNEKMLNDICKYKPEIRNSQINISQQEISISLNNIQRQKEIANQQQTEIQTHKENSFSFKELLQNNKEQLTPELKKLQKKNTCKIEETFFAIISQKNSKAIKLEQKQKNKKKMEQFKFLIVKNGKLKLCNQSTQKDLEQLVINKEVQKEQETKEINSSFFVSKKEEQEQPPVSFFVQPLQNQTVTQNSTQQQGQQHQQTNIQPVQVQTTTNSQPQQQQTSFFSGIKTPQANQPQLSKPSSQPLQQTSIQNSQTIQHEPVQAFFKNPIPHLQEHNITPTNSQPTQQNQPANLQKEIHNFPVQQKAQSFFQQSLNMIPEAQENTTKTSSQNVNLPQANNQPYQNGFANQQQQQNGFFQQNAQAVQQPVQSYQSIPQQQQFMLNNQNQQPVQQQQIAQPQIQTQAHIASIQTSGNPFISNINSNFQQKNQQTSSQNQQQQYPQQQTFGLSQLAQAGTFNSLPQPSHLPPQQTHTSKQVFNFNPNNNGSKITTNPFKTN